MTNNHGLKTRAAGAARAAVLFTIVFVALGCYSAPTLLYEIHPREEKNPGYDFVYFAEYTMLHAARETGTDSTQLTLLRKEELRRLFILLAPDAEYAWRAPDLFPIRLRVHNRAKEPVVVDYYRFRLRNLDTGKVYKHIDPREYEEHYYGVGTGVLDYYWAFEQKPEILFLHPIPDWYYRLRGPKSGSALEAREARRERVERVLRTHPDRTLLMPDQAVKGFLLFALIPPDYTYILEYDTPANQAGSARAFAFAPLVFDLRLTKEGEAVDADYYKKINEDRAYQLESQSDESARFNVSEVYRRHREYRERTATSGNSGAQSPDAK